MSVTITRPKDVSLEDLLELRLEIAPRRGEVPVLHRQVITIGQRVVVWGCFAITRVDGLFVYWPKRTQIVSFRQGRSVNVAPGDTLHVTLTWDL
jgi:hypothetical protein